jgi:phenylpropionate dioxygenase-like ring-hydroxylating dioxygenase large terminal subunit
MAVTPHPAGDPLTAADMDAEVLATYGKEPYLSLVYLAREKTQLWPKIWQMVERAEDFPDVGDWMTYNVADESIIVVRVAEGEGAGAFTAFHNVCPHRGRQLVSVPDGVHDVRGKNRRNFICGFHGWTFNAAGENTYIPEPQDWDHKLTPEMTCLSKVRVDTWGGYIYINMDETAAPLAEWMGFAGEVLEAHELSKMHYKWRQWAIYNCNWKVAIEAFLEPYHVAKTHSQLLAYGDYYAYSRQFGLHSVSGYDVRQEAFATETSGGTTRAGRADLDPRVSTYQLIKENYETVNFAASTETLVNAASRLESELPEGTSPADVVAHWIKSAKADDARRGVIWPEIPPHIQKESGLAWGLFPNQNILHGATYALCYRVRPFGDDPDKCIFESYALERFPDGEGPATEWIYAEPCAEKWGPVLQQDFDNMEFVHKGMKSSGFRGSLPNPHQEQKVINLHRNLAEFIGTGHPRKLK